MPTDRQRVDRVGSHDPAVGTLGHRAGPSQDLAPEFDSGNRREVPDGGLVDGFSVEAGDLPVAVQKCLGVGCIEVRPG